MKQSPKAFSKDIYKISLVLQTTAICFHIRVSASSATGIFKQRSGSVSEAQLST